MANLPTVWVGSRGQVSPLLWEMLRFLTFAFMPNWDKTLAYSNFVKKTSVKETIYIFKLNKSADSNPSRFDSHENIFFRLTFQLKTFQIIESCFRTSAVCQTGLFL